MSKEKDPRFIPGPLLEYLERCHIIERPKAYYSVTTDTIEYVDENSGVTIGVPDDAYTVVQNELASSTLVWYLAFAVCLDETTEFFSMIKKARSTIISAYGLKLNHDPLVPLVVNCE